MTKLTKAILVVGIVIVLLWHPFTRRIILVILPLGKGVDDLLFWILLLAFALIVFVKGWISIPKIKQYFTDLEREENE